MSVVNFNKAKKARAKRDKRARADENAVKFGRTKAQKERELESNEKSVQFLDGHKCEDEKGRPSKN